MARTTSTQSSALHARGVALRIGYSTGGSVHDSMPAFTPWVYTSRIVL